MSRRDAYFDAMMRELGAAYYHAVHGEGSAAEVTRAVDAIDERPVAAHPTAPPGSPAHGWRPRLRTGRWRVRDVMTVNPVCVRLDTPYQEVARLLHEHQLSALPVLDHSRRLTGMVSESDLLVKQERHHRRADAKPSTVLRPADRAKAEAATAGALMSGPVVSIRPQASVGTAARLLHARHLRRLPVIDHDGQLIGVVSRHDLLKTFLRPDSDIAAEVREVIATMLLADAAALSVQAHQGVLTLTGPQGNPDPLAAAARLAAGVDGVVSVEVRTAQPA